MRRRPRQGRGMFAAFHAEEAADIELHDVAVDNYRSVNPNNNQIQIESCEFDL